MGVCNACKKEMTDPATTTCEVADVEYPNGEKLPQVPYGHANRDSGDEVKAPCHDCRVHWGGVHHPGCDWEECPKCFGQLISCGCLDPDKEEDE